MAWIYCILHLLASFTALVMAGALCRTEISIPGMALDGFVFKIMSATAPHECEVHCEREITCQSYNYVIGERICELNNRTKEARPLNFRSDPARFYKRRSVDRVSLGSIPGLPAISCREIEASEGKYDINNKYWLDSSSTGQAELVDCSDTVKATVASLDRGKGQPQNMEDYDFELIFRKTQNTSYVKHDMNKNWLSHFTVCAWIHTPDLQQSQEMTVISILIEESGGYQKVVRLRIDGEGNIYFSFGSDGTSLSDVFTTSSPKDEMVFFCVRIQPYLSPKMEAIVNADFGSKKTSDGVGYEFFQWTQVIIGQNQNNDGTIANDTPFYGRISNLNIWLDLPDHDITDWFNRGQKHTTPNILKWPELGSSKRFGDVHFVKVTSAEREWRDVLDGEVVVQATFNVSATKSFESGSGVVIEVERHSPVSCSNASDSAIVDGVLISVNGSWKRIKYKQTFMETQKCFAIFGSVPYWASGIFSPGVSEFDLDLDELWKEEYLDRKGNHFDGVNTLCGDEHFWMVNQPNTPVAGISLRRESGASNAGISTFGKCGMFKFKISDIRVLE